MEAASAQLTFKTFRNDNYLIEKKKRICASFSKCLQFNAYGDFVVDWTPEQISRKGLETHLQNTNNLIKRITLTRLQ